MVLRFDSEDESSDILNNNNMSGNGNGDDAENNACNDRSDDVDDVGRDGGGGGDNTGETPLQQQRERRNTPKRKRKLIMISATDDDGLDNNSGGDDDDDDEVVARKMTTASRQELVRRTRTREIRERAMRERQEMDRRAQENLRIAEQREHQGQMVVKGGLNSSGDSDDSEMVAVVVKKSGDDDDDSKSVKSVAHVRYRDRLVNISKTDDEMDVLLSSELARQLKPHQLDSVRFCWDNICQQEDTRLQGCIIAHSMGLGKTLQTICFISVFFSENRGRRALVVCPKSVLRNWKQEFHKWRDLVGVDISVFKITDRMTSYADRRDEIRRWAKMGKSVFLISYDMAALLLHEKYRQMRPTSAATRGMNAEAHAKHECYQMADKYLLTTDLLILDEGHIIKNIKTVRYEALSRIHTRHRILLTGTPLQNRLKEYFTMIEFVRRGMWSWTEFKELFEEPINTGFKQDSDPQQVKDMLRASHVLTSEIRSFVHRRDATLLKESLPAKYEYVVSVKINEFQRVLYRAFLKEIERGKEEAIRCGDRAMVQWYSNVLSYSALTTKIIDHPDMLRMFCERRGLEAVPRHAPTMERIMRIQKQKREMRLISFDLNGSDHDGDDSAYDDQDDDEDTVYIIDDDYDENDTPGQDLSSLTMDPLTGEDMLDMDLLSMNSKSSIDALKIEGISSSGMYDRNDETKLRARKGKKLKKNSRVDRSIDLESPVIDLEEGDDDDNDDDDNEERVNGNDDIVTAFSRNGSESDWCVVRRAAPETQEQEGRDEKQRRRGRTTSTLDVDPEEDEMWLNAGDDIVDEVVENGLAFDWAWPVLVPGYKTGNAHHSSKMMLLLRIIEETLQRREKILIFSGYTELLDVIEDVLANTALDIREGEGELNDMDPEPTILRKNLHYCRLDGKVKSEERMRMIQDFNIEGSAVSVFLISTRAGGLGVNMIGANRVVIFDVSWNGAWDSQAIARSWRYGQTKPVYVYRFVASGTTEEIIRNVQMMKEWHIRKIVDSEAPTRLLNDDHFNMWKFDQSTPTQLEPLENFKDQYQTDEILCNICADDAWRRMIEHVVIHESLFEQDPADMLSEKEKEESKQEYQQRMKKLREQRSETDLHAPQEEDNDDDDDDVQLVVMSSGDPQ